MLIDEGGEDSPAYANFKREIERALPPGVLVRPEETPLSLRDCANKIIHARDFQFERVRFKTEDPRTGDTFSNETKDSSIKVFGEQSGYPWECRIDLLRLSEALHELVDRWVGGRFERM